MGGPRKGLSRGSQARAGFMGFRIILRVSLGGPTSMIRIMCQLVYGNSSEALGSSALHPMPTVKHHGGIGETWYARHAASTV